MLATVKEIYKYNKDEELKMLSAFTSTDTTADFWGDYKEHYNYFDRLFMKTYRSFLAFNAEGDEIDECADEFRADVYSWLTANDKRYSELYRVQLVSNQDDPITFNYDLKETYTGSLQRSVSDISGERQDSTSKSTVFGAKSTTYGEQSDTVGATSITYGQQSETVGARKTTRDYDETQGAHTDNIEVDNSYGAQHNVSDKDLTYDDVSVESENKVSAYNDSGYVAKDFNKTDTGSRQDNETTTDDIGAHSDSLDTETRYGAQTISKDETISEDAHTDTKAAHTDSTTAQTNVHGSHTDSETSHTDSELGTAIKGAQTDTHTQTGQDAHSIRRYGNIGVQTTSDILKGHVDLWTVYNFYKIIFDDIANEFLRVR